MTDFAVAFHTLGCKVNQVENEAIAAQLLGAGARLVDEAHAAVIVINTCSVTGEADAKARKAVRHALRAAGSPVVVVTGCGASLDPETLAALGERVVVETDKSQVAARVAALFAEGVSRPAPPAVRAGRGFHTRALLKIEDGCDAFCAYCIVPYARGVPRAVPLDELVAEAAALVAAGTREIVLTGINVGRYRRGDVGLPLVIEAVAASGVGRLRLSSIEPLDLTAELLGTIASTPAFCSHLHVPLQSGSDAVLSAMGRRYTAEEFAERIDAAREAIPRLAISTDVMCGFPGEIDDNAAETLAFVERVGFAKLHVFRYSERPGTRAATMAGSVAPEVRAARAATLRELGDRLRAAYFETRAGCEVAVLIEKVTQSRAIGTTDDYLRVELPSDGASVGSLAIVRLGAAGVQVLG